MKKKPLIIAAVSTAAAILLLVCVWILSREKTDVPLENAQQLYTKAFDEVSAAQNMTLHISKIQEMTIDTEVFCEIAHQELLCSGLGTENVRLSTTENIAIGGHSFTASESFSNNIAYMVINDTGFSCPINSADYIKRFIPVDLLNPALYNNITGVDDHEQYIINFSEPAGTAFRETDRDFILSDANGTAYVSHDEQLTKSIYKLTYNHGKAQIRITYTIDIVLETNEITPPDNAASFHVIDYLDGPKMLERATGYLLQTNNISAHYTDNIYFQAFGDSRTQDITLYMANHENLSALVKTLTKLKNDSRVGQDTQLSKIELFADNRYLVSTDDNKPIESSNITAYDMRQYCQNRLVSTVMLPKHITGAQIISSEKSVRIQYSASEEFANLISSNACQSLYQQPELLNDLAQSCTTETLQCYLELDKITGLPIASGISYSGTHNVAGTAYSLSYKADQIYDLLSQITPEEIKKAAE